MSSDQPKIRPTRAEVDVRAICDNAAVLARVARAPLMAVVKADAYGHGADLIATILAHSGSVAGFAVSLVEEGVCLRESGVVLPIWVMGPALDGGYHELIARDLTAILSDPGDLEALARAARARDTRVVAHLKVDTGMGRLGIAAGDAGRVFARARSLDSVRIEGLATHFACAETDDPADPTCLTHVQLARFDAAVAEARRAGLTPRVLHTANSAATLRFPGARRDAVRCGLALYGNGCGAAHSGVALSPGPGPGSLRQAMRLVSEIVQLRWAEEGSSVSYGALWRAPRRSRLAVIPVGYADGLPRSVTGSAQVLLAGQRCPLVGAVSMDICVADVTDLAPEPKIGDDVVLLGAQGNQQIAVREYATWAGCTEYEVTCGISKRVPRRIERSER